MKNTVVIAAGGVGKRMGAGKNKLFLKVGGHEILYYTVSAFEKNDKIDEIVIAAGKDDIPAVREIIELYGFGKVSHIVQGGESRQQSVMNGLMASSGSIVLIHDGARALVTDDVIGASIENCIKYGAAAAGVKCKDTIKRTDEEGFVENTVDREYTYLIQTPQVFFLDKILDMHKKARAEGFEATDDCMIAERFGVRIKISPGSYENIKLTTPEDMIVAENILRRRGEL